jgi:hypothetical protein
MPALNPTRVVERKAAGGPAGSTSPKLGKPVAKTESATTLLNSPLNDLGREVNKEAQVKLVVCVCIKECARILPV